MLDRPAIALLLLAGGCMGAIDDPRAIDPEDPHGPRMDGVNDPTTPGATDPTEAPLRRLNRRELENTVTALVGAPIEGALDTIPGDSRELVYDRMGASQSVSPLHVEGFYGLGEAITNAALADDAILGRLVPGCDLAALGPRARPATSTTVGSSLAPQDPEYGLCYAGDDWSGSNRCPTVTDPDEVSFHFDGTHVTLTHTIAASGRYRLEVLAAATGSGGQLVVSSAGTELGRFAISSSPLDARVYDTYSIEVDLAAAEHDLQIERQSSGGVYLESFTIAGPIDPTATADAPARDACIDAFSTTFAPRVWRRPLSAEEESTVETLFREGTADGFWFDGLRMALLFLLQSPEFLYHVEIGEPTASPGVYGLDDFEIASRLSYLAWEAPPDDALWDAAARGELRTPDQVRAQAERLFGDPRAHTTIRTFYEQWLALDELDQLTKDVASFPEFTPAVRAAMHEETTTFLDAMIWDEGAAFADILVAPHTYLPPDLASIYGVTAPSSTSRVDLPEGRLGLLTHPSLLAVHSKPTGHSPVRRGVFVLERLLCTELPSPPPDVDFAAPETSVAPTTRDRFAEHTTNPSCASCHAQIDTIGFMFESFDTIGRWQTHENGVAVDTTGGVPTLGIAPGSIDGAAELARALAESGEPDRCLTRQWLRFALGRRERAADAESLERSLAVLEADGMRDMLVAWAATDSFLHRFTEEEDR